MPLCTSPQHFLLPYLAPFNFADLESDHCHVPTTQFSGSLFSSLFARVLPKPQGCFLSCIFHSVTRSIADEQMNSLGSEHKNEEYVDIAIQSVPKGTHTPTPNKILCACVQSCLTLCNPMDCSPAGSSLHAIFSVKNTGRGCHFLLQGIPQARDKTCVSGVSCICRWILYHYATWETCIKNQALPKEETLTKLENNPLRIIRFLHHGFSLKSCSI